MEKAVECFVPLLEERRPYSDRVRRVSVAAFPGYVFCRIDLNHRLGVLNTPGVQYLVGSGGMPEAVHNDEIGFLRQAFSKCVDAAVIPYLANGDRVLVVAGPMSGAAGILLRVKGQQRLVISIHLLQRSISVEVDESHVCLAESIGSPDVARVARDRALTEMGRNPIVCPFRTRASAQEAEI